MSKGLEALRRIGNMPTQNNMGISMINTLRDYGIVEKELQALEIIKPILQAAFIFKENGTEIGKIYMSKDVEKIIKEWLKHE